jgi:putative ABC transport system permease protein
VRTTGDPRSLLEPIRRLLHQRDPDLPLVQVATMDEVMAAAVEEQRFSTTLMSGFALVALVLAGIGVYAVISYSVSGRRREIGIRIALGARAETVRNMVVRQGLRPAAAGVASGLLAAAGLSRFLHALLVGVTPLDLATYVFLPSLLLLVALGAILVPAWRASRVAPLEALRHE